MAIHGFPHGKRFAFSFIDDTDVSTVENIRPVYDLLSELGILGTKTVWPVPCPEGSKNFSRSQTLADPEYCEFVQDLQERGFEITWHGATMESSERTRTEQALARFEEVFGKPPSVHANHADNRENIYWGTFRFDNSLLRTMFRLWSEKPVGYFQGEVKGSKYWWGDLCAEHIRYARNLTFNEINMSNINPSMPYHDHKRPIVRWWFSATDAEDVTAFTRQISNPKLDRLEKEGGVCIVATHFGKGFSRNGRVVESLEKCVRNLASREGWFVTVSELLDWLRESRDADNLPSAEWRRMQWIWLRDMLARKLHDRM